MKLLKIFGWLVVLGLVAVLLTQIVMSVGSPNPNIGGDVGGAVGIFISIIAAYMLFIWSKSPLHKLISV